MNQWSPCKRKDFVRRLRRLEFEGPFAGAHHQFMVYKERRLALPSNREYSVPQLKMMLREVKSVLNREVSSEEWNKL